MNKLNGFLFVLLTVLVVVSAVGSVIAYSEDGNGTLSYVEEYDDDSSDVVVIEDSGNSEPSHDNGGSVPLTNHETANPIVLLMSSLALLGFSAKHLRK